MSISYIAVRNECRRRMIEASGINPENDLQVENYVFDPKRKKAWVSEFCIGGEEVQLSSSRSRISSFLVQYDICVQETSGTEKIEIISESIARAFDVSDPKKSILQTAEAEMIVKSVKRESKKMTGVFVKSILLTLDVVQKS